MVQVANGRVDNIINRRIVAQAFSSTQAGSSVSQEMQEIDST